MKKIQISAPRNDLRLSPPMRIAKVLGVAKKGVWENRPIDSQLATISHLYLCQKVAFELEAAGIKFNRYRFSKLCGYDFTI